MATNSMRLTAAMVKSILDGRKTQTRRQVGNQFQSKITSPKDTSVRCTYGSTGDLLRIYEQPHYSMPYKYMLTVQLTDVHMERIQSITDLDIIAHGLTIPSGMSLRKGFADHWDTRSEWWEHTSEIIREYARSQNPCRWEFNPWVWAMTFRLLSE